MNYKTISLSITVNNMDNDPFSQVTLYETGSNFPSKEMKTKIFNNLSFTRNNNELNFLTFYTFTSQSSQYFYLVIEPKQDIDYITISYSDFTIPPIDITIPIPSISSDNYDFGYDKIKKADSDSEDIATFFWIFIVAIVIIIIVAKKCKTESHDNVGEIIPVSPLLEDNSQNQNRLNQ